MLGTVSKESTINLFRNYLEWFIKNEVKDIPAPEPEVIEAIIQPIVEVIKDKVASYGVGQSRFIDVEMEEEKADK